MAAVNGNDYTGADTSNKLYNLLFFLFSSLRHVSSTLELFIKVLSFSISFHILLNPDSRSVST